MLGSLVVPALGALPALGAWLAGHVLGLQPLPCVSGCGDPLCATINFVVQIFNSFIGHPGCPNGG